MRDSKIYVWVNSPFKRRRSDIWGGQ